MYKQPSVFLISPLPGGTICSSASFRPTVNPGAARRYYEKYQLHISQPPFKSSYQNRTFTPLQYISKFFANLRKVIYFYCSEATLFFELSNRRKNAKQTKRLYKFSISKSCNFDSRNRSRNILRDKMSRNSVNIYVWSIVSNSNPRRKGCEIVDLAEHISKKSIASTFLLIIYYEMHIVLLIKWFMHLAKLFMRKLCVWLTGNVWKPCWFADVAIKVNT